MGAADLFAEAAIFVVGVDDEYLDVLVEEAERFEFGEVGLAGARAGENDAVVIVLSEAVVDDRGAGVGEAVEASLVLERRLACREGEGGGERRAVEGAPQAEPVEAERQTGEPAVEGAEGRWGAAEELRGAKGADPLGGVGELVLGCGGDGQVEAGAEEAALTAREPACELVCVLGGGGDAEVGEAPAF
jgi:hypothetical protein